MSDTVRRAGKRWDEGARREARDPGTTRPRLEGRLSMRAFWSAVDPDRDRDQPSAPIKR